MRLLKSHLAKYGYLLIVLLALFFRLYHLGQVPPGITHDEVHDLINAKSVALSGESTPESIHGIFTRKAEGWALDVYGDLVSFLLVPWMLIFPLSLFWSKIPFVLVSLSIVFLSGKLFENLTGKKNIGLLASLLVAINPWAIHFGRSAYENLFAYSFTLLGLCFFTRRRGNKINLALGTIACFLGFLSYFGMKPLFLLVVVIGTAYHCFSRLNNDNDNKKRNTDQFNKKELLVSGLLTILIGFILTGGYLLLLKNSPAGIRLGELSVNSQQVDLKSEVDYQRRVSLEIPYIRDLLINKYLVLAKDYLTRYFAVLSPGYLFGQGEQGFDTYIISNHAFMYLIDFPLVIFGLIFLSSSMTATLFIISLIAILPITTLMSKFGANYYALRVGLLFPLLCGLSAVGIVGLYERLKGNFKAVFALGTVGIYIVSFIYFLAMYWYRTPFEKNNGWYFPERALMRYLNLLEQRTDRKVFVVTANQQSPLFYLYAFYSGKYEKKESILRINEAIRSVRYSIGNVTFTDRCPNKEDLKTNIYIFDGGVCNNNSSGLPRIASTRDTGQRFVIVNDPVCNELILNRYPYPRKIAEFNVEKMSREQFCKTWITLP